MSRWKYLWCRVIAEPDSLEIVMVVFRKCYGVTLDCGSAWTVRERGTVRVCWIVRVRGTVGVRWTV